jgi:hypothetical protein
MALSSIRIELARVAILEHDGGQRTLRVVQPPPLPPVRELEPGA